MKSFQHYATVDPRYLVNLDEVRARQRKERVLGRLMDLNEVMAKREELHRDCEERLILELSMAEHSLRDAQREPVNQARLGQLERMVGELKRDVRRERDSFWRDTWKAKMLLWELRD